MRFRIWTLSILCLLSSPAHGATTQSPLGFVIRPAFFENLAKGISDRKQTFKFEKEIGDLKLSGSFQFGLGKPVWIGAEGKPLVIELPIETYHVAGSMVSKGQTLAIFSAESEKLILNIQIIPENIYLPDAKVLPLHVDPFDQAAPYFKPKMSFRDPLTSAPLKQIQSIFEAEAVRLYLWSELKKILEVKFSKFISDHLRNFVLVESLAGIMKDSPVWKEGTILTRGGLTIEMDGLPVSERRGIFAMTPFISGGAYVNSQGLEVYTDARFLRDEELTQLNGPKTSLMSAEELAVSSRVRLAKPDSWNAAAFKRPSLIKKNSDMSLVIPTYLVNDALSTVYREGLLRFKTTIHLGKQTQGIVTPLAPEVAVVVGISPRSAPRIEFSTQRPILQIIDYALDISTSIEDRLIPSSNILTNASISSEIRVASNPPTINLKLSPETFKMNVQDLSGRMSLVQKDIFERLANGVWKDFLSQYSDLVLFPSVIATNAAEIKIVGVDMNESFIQLHVNLAWGDLEL